MLTNKFMFMYNVGFSKLIEKVIWIHFYISTKLDLGDPRYCYILNKFI